jgi:hypothetical protein
VDVFHEGAHRFTPPASRSPGVSQAAGLNFTRDSTGRLCHVRTRGSPPASPELVNRAPLPLRRPLIGAGSGGHGNTSASAWDGDENPRAVEGVVELDAGGGGEPCVSAIS